MLPFPTQEIETFMAGAGDAGIILFSMGFIFNPSVVPAARVRAILDAFGRLPQRVILKVYIHSGN